MHDGGGLRETARRRGNIGHAKIVIPVPRFAAEETNNVMATHFDLTDVQLIVNVGDSLSLTRAAEKTHLSVPAASMRIKNLEDYFRTRLLYRTNQG